MQQVHHYLPTWRFVDLQAPEHDVILMQEGVRDLEHCLALVSTMGLFSKNEAIEDVSTNSLKYLLVPIFLANLTSQMYMTDPVARMKQMERAFELCSRYIYDSI